MAAKVTCSRLFQLHVACWKRPFALAGLNGSFAQQDLAFMLHYAAHYLDKVKFVRI